MPAKINLPEREIVNLWRNDISATSRSIAKDLGCGHSTISAIVSRHISVEDIHSITRAKISASTARRPDLKTDSHRGNCRHARSFRTHESILSSITLAISASVAVRKGKPFSEERRRQISESRIGVRSGDKSHLWRGGTAKVSWRGPGWTIARRDARERDGNTCQLCGAVENIGRWKNMDVHHIQSFYAFASPKDANVLSNLICLCRTCHKRVECGYPCPKPKS
jgi:5-methylcytosine-specific restriction endonuclease McrA